MALPCFYLKKVVKIYESLMSFGCMWLLTPLWNISYNFLYSFVSFIPFLKLVGKARRLLFYGLEFVIYF
jgi:hypothetical protein